MEKQGSLIIKKWLSGTLTPSLADKKQTHSRQSLSPFRLKMNYLAAGFIIAFLTLATAGITLQSPYISTVCKLLDNCARDREFEGLYTQALTEGEGVILKMDNAETFEELKDYRDRLLAVMGQLKNLPTDVSIYPQSQQVLTRFQQQLNKVDATLFQEETAQKKLTKTSQLALEATQILQTANSLKDYQQAKQQWEQIQQQLNQISSDKFLASQLQTEKQATETTLNTIDNKIQEINNQINRKQQFRQQFNNINNLIKQAMMTTESAKTIEDYNLSKGQWETIQEQLKNINTDGDTQLQEQINNQLLAINQQIERINTNIKNLKNRQKTNTKPKPSPSPKTSQKPDKNEKEKPQTISEPSINTVPLW